MIEIFKNLSLLFAGLMSLLVEYTILINTISIVLFIGFVMHIYTSYSASFFRYLFPNLGMIFLVVSSYLIDIYPGVYLIEIDKYTELTNLTSIVSLYIYPMISALNVYRNKKLKVRAVHYSEYSVASSERYINALMIILIFSFLYMFSEYGLPILDIFNRIEYFNSLPDVFKRLYLLLSVFSLYSGFMYYKTMKNKYVFFMFFVIVVRILSLQKFTELLLDITLFYAFYSYNLLESRASKAKVFLPLLLIGSVLLAFISYDKDFDVLKGRLMAQSQQAYYINKEIGRAIDVPEIVEVSSEFNNFLGDKDDRLELFSKGKTYGLFRLLDVSETGRDLMYQARESTSSSGSIPIIFIYYFGYTAAYFILILITLLLKFLYENLLLLIIQTNNIYALFLSSLIFLRIYKFFIIGSPSYLYNKQFFLYGFLILVVIKLKINFRCLFK